MCFRDVVIHTVDDVSLLNLQENSESDGSSLFVLFYYFFLFYSNAKRVYVL